DGVEASQRAAGIWPLVRGLYHDSRRLVRADHGRFDAENESSARRSPARAITSRRGREKRTMTGLLVSVRSAAEAETALAGGADVVDVKEPRRGALGPADPSVWKQV